VPVEQLVSPANCFPVGHGIFSMLCQKHNLVMYQGTSKEVAEKLILRTIFRKGAASAVPPVVAK
jgi:hypothetical protein